MRSFSYGVLVVFLAAAFALSAQAQQGGGRGARGGGAGAAAANMPTPRTPDGHPDFSGMWGGGRGMAPPADEDAVASAPAPVAQSPSAIAQAAAAQAAATGGGIQGAGGTLHYVTPDLCEVTRESREGSVINLEEDAYVLNHQNAVKNEPMYKPEYWDQVRHLNEIGYRTTVDPGFACYANPGLSRLGMPAEIVQFPTKILLVYAGEGSPVREIFTDGRKLPSPDDYDGTRIMGTSVGHWDGDALVIDTVDISADGTWLGNQGWFHSAEMTVRERLQRQGNTLTLDMTINDPVFIKPWVLPTKRANLNTNPNAVLAGPTACIENDGGHLVGTQ